MLGLPHDVKACLFDLDGVLTQTAKVHAAAWKAMFDEFLQRRAAERGEPFVPFDAGADYDRYVDGRPRLDGTRTFLAARGIDLPDGLPATTPPSTLIGVGDADAGHHPAETVHGLSNRKNQLVGEYLSAGKVEVYQGSVRYVRAARDAGLARAVVSSSANTAQVLEVAGIADLFETRVDGVVAAEQGLAGKPAPDTFLAAAETLGVRPDQAAVFEDALAGVEAGHRGGFSLVVGVDRTGQADALRQAGADVVVGDLSELMEGDT